MVDCQPLRRVEPRLGAERRVIDPGGIVSSAMRRDQAAPEV
jgi:hypothetical protein